MDKLPEINLNLPVEVQLAWEVMTCRAMRAVYDKEDHPCKWFNNTYGPYQAYDWIKDFPEKELKSNEKREIDAKCVGKRYQIPELMSGCRKAPIMTIGINPNLTAFFPGKNGATWCYPYFDDIAQYANYFRYRSIYQEHFDLEFVKKHVVKGTEKFAKSNGKIVSAVRDFSSGEINLRIIYDDQPEGTLVLPKKYVVFFDSRTDKDSTFNEGDLLAGIVNMEQDENTNVEQSPVGYYERFENIFDKLKNMLPIDLNELRMGEDVCQADMVACASPGWKKYIPDEKIRNGIVDECVINRGWLALQVLQTKPKVIVFSGGDALEMFYQIFKKEIDPQFDIHRDIYDLLKLCCEREFYLKINKDGINFQTRLIFSPHFSYDENFIIHCRFSKSQWEDFCKNYPHAYDILKGIVKDDYSKTCKVIEVSKIEPLKNQLGDVVWDCLMKHKYDACELIASVIKTEFAKKNIGIDEKTHHLIRSDGPCVFCKNDLFEFKESCKYNKIPPDEKHIYLFSKNDINKTARSFLNNITINV